jgi:cell shape-determining protein MreC
MSNEEIYNQLKEAWNAKENIENEIERLSSILAESIALESRGIRLKDRVTDYKGKLWIVEYIKLDSWESRSVGYFGVRLMKNGKPGKRRDYIYKPELHS